jgi:predicted metal-dependent phosphoesterase TrpH
MTAMLRADLHVHTCHSTQSGNMRFLRSRDCYSRPADVYRVARARGMDLVAFTDHDSIGGAMELLNDRPELAPEIIVGEEVSCRLPDGGLQVHIAAYGMDEALHRDVQALRGNVFDVVERLRAAGVFFSLNHLLHFYRGEIPLARYVRLLDDVPALEVRNGAMAPAHNLLLERIAGGQVPGLHARRFAATAGSDAHTLRRVGTTWTEAPGRNRDEYLASLRQGLGVAGGVHGTALTIAGDAYSVIGSYVASLAGFGRCDLRSWRRAACLAFSAASLPFQFIPLMMAARSKAGERRAIAALTSYVANPALAASAAAHLAADAASTRGRVCGSDHRELPEATRDRQPLSAASTTSL